MQTKRALFDLKKPRLIYKGVDFSWIHSLIELTEPSNVSNKDSYTADLQPTIRRPITNILVLSSLFYLWPFYETISKGYYFSCLAFILLFLGSFLYHTTQSYGNPWYIVDCFAARLVILTNFIHVLQSFYMGQYGSQLWLAILSAAMSGYLYIIIGPLSYTTQKYLLLHTLWHIISAVGSGILFQIHL